MSQDSSGQDTTFLIPGLGAVLPGLSQAAPVSIHNLHRIKTRQFLADLPVGLALSFMNKALCPSLDCFLRL